MSSCRVLQLSRHAYKRNVIGASPVGGVSWMWRCLSSSSYPPHEVVRMPSLSPTMESGQITAWNVSPGQSFSAGDVFCQVQTDKATIDFDASDDGVIAKLLVEAGPDDIPCGTPVLITVDDEDDVAAFEDYAGGDTKSAEPVQVEAAPVSTPAAAPVSATPTPVTTPATATATAPPGGKVIASPLAFKLAKDLNLDISSLIGTGPGGRIIADDVREFTPAASVTTVETSTSPTDPLPAATALPPPIVGENYTDFSLSSSALQTAAKLLHSKQHVPHYYLMTEVELDDLLALRNTLNSSSDDEDDKLTLFDLLLKASAKAMLTVPSANASWMDTHVRQYHQVHINVSLQASDSGGLFTPLLSNVDTIGLKDLSKQFKTMQQKAQEGTLTTTDCAMGTFSVVNLGMYGITSAAPIILEPQSCMLALGAAQRRIVPSNGDNDDEVYEEKVMLTATLSCDHRVVDGAVGAQWLQAFKKIVESPSLLLL